MTMTISNTRKYSEEAILGVLLSFPEYFPQVAERIQPEHFASEENKGFYEFIKKCAESDKGWDFEIFLDQFPEASQAWAMEIMEMGRPELLNDYIERVRLKHIARKIFEESAKGVDVDVSTVKDLVEDFYAQDNIREEIVTADIFEQALESMNSKAELIEMPIDYLDLNFRIGGLVKGEFMVVAGRPGHSKSMFLTNLILKPMFDGRKVIMVDYEMSPLRMVQRLTSIDNNMPLYWNKRVNLGGSPLEPHQIEKVSTLISVTKERYKDQFMIAKMQTLASIEAKIIKHKPDILTIDTLQAFAQDQVKDKGVSDASHVSSICRRLRNMAEKYNICVIACSQLNIRDDSVIPHKGHMKESGGIEEAASTILCVRNRQIAFPENMNEVGCYDLRIAKNRNGEEALRDLYNNASTGRISEVRVTPSIGDELAL